MISIILQEEFDRIRNKNASYSLRAFAKKIQISSGALTEILKGERKISKKMAFKLLQNLELSKEKEELFLSEFSSAKKVDEELEYFLLQQDQYKVISQWWHFAIMNLTRLNQFEPDINWIAHRLGLPINTIIESTDRLFKLNLLEVKEGTWKRTKERITTTDDISDCAIKNFHHQTLHLAAEKLDDLPVESRDFTSIIFPMDKNKFEKLKQKIREFQDEVSLLFEDGELNQIYQLNINSYPISTSGGNEQ